MSGSQHTISAAPHVLISCCRAELVVIFRGLCQASGLHTRIEYQMTNFVSQTMLILEVHLPEQKNMRQGQENMFQATFILDLDLRFNYRNDVRCQSTARQTRTKSCFVQHAVLFCLLLGTSK